MLKKLRRLLELADFPGAWAFTADDLDYWAGGIMDQLIEFGVLKEIAPAQSVICRDCGEEECFVEPDIRTDPDNGRMVGMYHCPADHGVGTAFFELDRFRQWRLDNAGIASRLAAIIGAVGGTGEIVPDRLWFLGTVRQEGRLCELFFARGLIWPDADKVIDQATRLRGSVCPALLVPVQRPPLDFWRFGPPVTAALTEILRWEEQTLRLDLGRLFEQLDDLRNRPKEETRPDIDPPTTAPLLTETELTILQAMAAQPGRAMQLADVMAAGGYGKQATRKSLSRLREHGLITKPPGTTRRGDVITRTGEALVTRLVEQPSGRS